MSTWSMKPTVAEAIAAQAADGAARLGLVTTAGEVIVGLLRPGLKFDR